jgi:hypothetical protein
VAEQLQGLHADRASRTEQDEPAIRVHVPKSYAPDL